ncbi:Glutathione S-transferase 2 [Metarhizium acridum]|nr:Glutathione S-transferase 2 [Metarhizium acridum]
MSRSGVRSIAASPSYHRHHFPKIAVKSTSHCAQYLSAHRSPESFGQRPTINPAVLDSDDLCRSGQTPSASPAPIISTPRRNNMARPTGLIASKGIELLTWSTSFPVALSSRLVIFIFTLFSGGPFCPTRHLSSRPCILAHWLKHHEGKKHEIDRNRAIYTPLSLHRRHVASFSSAQEH